jgi:hypothetical protein
VNKALIIGRRSPFFFFSCWWLYHYFTRLSVFLSICLFVCSAIRTKDLSIWKSVIFACVVQPAACVVCTTRTVIYVVLCTLNLDPANDLVDLGKKEAAAESRVSFFFPDFFFVKTLRHAHKTIWSQKNERNINKDEKNTLFAMACYLCYLLVGN